MSVNKVILTNLDLNGNSLKNVSLEILPEDPNTNLSDGRFYLNSESGQLRIYKIDQETGDGHWESVTSTTDLTTVLGDYYSKSETETVINQSINSSVHYSVENGVLSLKLPKLTN